MPKNWKYNYWYNFIDAKNLFKMLKTHFKSQNFPVRRWCQIGCSRLTVSRGFAIYTFSGIWWDHWLLDIIDLDWLFESRLYADWYGFDNPRKLKTMSASASAYYIMHKTSPKWSITCMYCIVNRGNFHVEIIHVIKIFMLIYFHGSMVPTKLF